MIHKSWKNPRPTKQRTTVQPAHLKFGTHRVGRKPLSSWCFSLTDNHHLRFKSGKLSGESHFIYIVCIIMAAVASNPAQCSSKTEKVQPPEEHIPDIIEERRKDSEGRIISNRYLRGKLLGKVCFSFLICIRNQVVVYCIVVGHSRY